MKQTSTLCPSDIAELYGLLYSKDNAKKSEGVAMANVIRLRGNVEVGLDGTAALVSVQLSDNNSADEYTVQSGYAIALIRTVNGLTDRQQIGNYMTSMKTLAGRIKLPYKLVDIRHEATHQQLPPMPALRQSAALMIDWLRHNYWEPLLQETHEDTITKCVQELQGFVKSPNQFHPAEFVDRLIAASCLTGLPGAVIKVIYINKLNPSDVLGDTGDCSEFHRFLKEVIAGGLSEALRGSIISPLFGRLFSDALLSHYCIVNMIMRCPGNSGKLSNAQQFDLCIKWLYGILDYVGIEEDTDVRDFSFKLIQKAVLAVLANTAPQFLTSLEASYKKESARFHKIESNTEFTLDDIISFNEPVVTSSDVAGMIQLSNSDTPSGCLAKFLQDLVHKYRMKLSGLQLLLGIQSSDADIIIHRSTVNELIPIGTSSLLGSMWTDDTRLHAYYYKSLGPDCPVLIREDDQKLEAQEPPLKQ